MLSDPLAAGMRLALLHHFTYNLHITDSAQLSGLGNALANRCKGLVLVRTGVQTCPSHADTAWKGVWLITSNWEYFGFLQLLCKSRAE